MPIRVSHLDAFDVALTLVVERTPDPNSWEIVTGWTASPHERKVVD
jgi:hypothetical protein